MTKFTLFYGGVFSQWYPSDFEIDGVKYNCAEQYMMAEKARLFKDDVALDGIMFVTDKLGRKTPQTNPRIMKAWGRKVKNFDPVLWDEVSTNVVTTATLAKFADPRLKKLLDATKGTTLVEASPTDKIWGIGRAASDPLCHDRKHWRGENRLGQILSAVRDLTEREARVLQLKFDK